MEYLNQMKNRRRSSQVLQAPKPVLTEEEEAFLREVTSSENGASSVAKTPLPGAEVPPESSPPFVLNEGADQVPLPTSPAEEFGKELGEQGRRASQLSGSPVTKEPTNLKTDDEAIPVDSAAPAVSDKKKKRWSTMFWKKNGDSKKNKDKDSSKEDPSRSQTSVPPSTAAPTADNEQDAQKDQEDMTDILERLNLAADNNRVFSISDDTQELLRKFKLIFKDLINGVPTAYRDLEMLLTNGNRQLQDTYTKLPGFLQKLIEKLPEKWTETLAPEMIAVASERATQSGVNMENVGKAAAAAEKMGVNIPSLKELVSKPAAIVGMLRSIMAFLRARFPAVLGMNVLWSLALFILLFVLWYCHKRGREVRLENERLVTEEEINRLNENTTEGKIRPTETFTTTAPQGASAEEIREGVRKVEQARASSALEAASSEPLSPKEETETTPSFAPPTRSKSRLSIFGRSKSIPGPSSPDIAPYPGT
ncbi:hypothetical protein N7466_008807 [Penicillium verhagenii]|uniref:uncharacterized protein n=1 Tax=Penicillium verhagenii TaxID=1562060 RepID=UPI00254537D0|nr:uncharacterized protein N7466_008807 [Penicillium verhagenii]KAJ5924620.1 hypothetical protein N7466_008807 [Penicillium verhagenii]